VAAGGMGGKKAGTGETRALSRRSGQGADANIADQLRALSAVR
jgi:hypothetical protein